MNLQVILPGEDGEFGVTAGHSPMISQLQPGLVTVVHTSGESEKFFVSGGFAITKTEGTDVSCPEAFPLSEFDPAVVKSGKFRVTLQFRVELVNYYLIILHAITPSQNSPQQWLITLQKALSEYQFSVP